MPLELAARGALQVRREDFRDGQTPACRLLYASDLHLGWRHTEPVVMQLLRVIENERPDYVLLGGDLVDGRAGFFPLERLIRAAARQAPVLAIPGNHDRLVESSALRHLVENAGGEWIADGRRTHRTARRTVIISGALGASSPLLEARDFPVLVAHNPAVFPRAAALRYRLVLAGHLHGGQVILWEKNGLMYPGAFVYPWNGLRFDRHGSTMIVSRGCADTLPVRWNCPRDVVLCTL